MRQNMSFSHNTTHQLWAAFMPRKKEIANTVPGGRFSLQNYGKGFFEHFSPVTLFEKWAAVPVSTNDIVPAGMEAFTIPKGKYAVFQYKGSSANAAAVFRYIFEVWLPQSGYQLDVRPHFEILGDKYINGSDESEEAIYIPLY